MLRLCSGLLTIGSGKSSSSSLPEIKTEPAKEKINLESMGIQSRSSILFLCPLARGKREE